MNNPKHTLIQAIKEGDLEQVKSVLKNDASLANAMTEEGLSIFLLAKYYRKSEIAKALLQHKTEFDLFEATASGRINFIEKHLNTNPERVNEYSSDGFSPLGLACFFGQKEAVDFLLKKGADVNQISNNPMKLAPLHSAVASQKIEIVKMLIEKGADVNAQQMKGVTPLHSAAHNGLVNIAKFLLETGANPQIKMEDGTLPIDFAKKDNHPEVVVLLENYSKESKSK